MTEETMEMFNERIKELLELAKNYEASNGMRKAIMQEVYELSELYIKSTEMDQKILDNELRRRLDEKKAETMAQIEREKNAIPKTRIMLETGKIVVPLASTMLMLYAYFKAQDKMFVFEEHGSITSSAGRQLGLPRVFKF